MIAPESTGQRLPGDDLKAFRRHGLGYVYEPTGLGVRFVLDRIISRGEDLTGELAVSSLLPGISTHLHRSRANLLSTTSREKLASFLLRMAGRELERPWIKVLEELFTAVVEAERVGEPFVIAGRKRVRPVRPPDTIEKIAPAKKPTSIFAPGGTGKGYVVIGMAACIQAGIPFAGFNVVQGNVLYLDWEDDLETFEERLWMVSRGLGLDESVPLHYRLCRGPLRSQLFELARYVGEQSIDVVVIDSFGKAAGSAGEHGTYESVANQFDEALRQLGSVTSLVIDHVDGQSVKDGKLAGKAIGSIYKMNWVRQAWEVMKQQDLGSPYSRLGLYHAKGNHSGTLEPIGLSLDFSEADAVYIRREVIEGGSDTARHVPIADRLVMLLKAGARTVRDLADELGETQDSVRRKLNARKDRFVSLPDSRWGLRGQPAMPDRNANRPFSIVRNPPADDEPEDQPPVPWYDRD